MKKLENFKNQTIELSLVFGGTQYIDTTMGEGDYKMCDCLEDSNDNGIADPGECMEVIAC